MGDELGPWEPLTVEETTRLLAGCPVPWWIAGGWAIDLHLGRQTRAHADTDVVVLRPGLAAVQHHLRGWDLQAADPPGQLRPWRDGEVLPAQVQDVWCRREAAGPWRFQFMVSEVDGGEWVYRRDPRIRLPVAALSGPASTVDAPVLAPEVQLLHKSRRLRDKDAADFRAVLPALDGRRRGWLHDALALSHPGHPWLPELPARSVHDAAGGREGLLRLAEAWHRRVLADEVVAHAFSHGFRADHTERLAAYWIEALGGPPAYAAAYGDETSVVRIHSGNGEHDEMDRRAIACFDLALSDAGLDGEPVRQVLLDHFAWATRTTMAAYHHSADDVPDGLAIPRWSWDGLQPR